ncbi:MAG: FKBP-type peptidyl-prolyl cis-trans isomerase [Planctomycetales bacterium]|nr:FKBP-type peptidyl-prolyl cis-trans isomerase [Planctomycetales bacterium]
MYRSIVAVVSLVLVAGELFAQAPDGPAAKPADAGSYSIGISIGRDIARNGGEVDLRSFVLGFRDGLEGNDAAFTDEELQAAMRAFQQAAVARIQKANGDKGSAFLAANAKKPGVKQTKSGLQYKIIKQGDGATPKPSDTVRAHYEGTLIDGTVFDSSYRRGEPADFPVEGVIKGWTEALQMMKVGDKWQLFIPAELAYGESGTPGGPIGPNETLIFQVELLGVQ